MADVEPLRLELLHDDDACAYGSIGPVLILAWRHSILGPYLEKFALATSAQAAKYPTGFVALTFAPSKVRPPDAAAREQIAALARQSPPHFRRSVSVLAGDGFVVSVMRSVMAGLAIVVPKKAVDHLVKDTATALAKIETL